MKKKTRRRGDRETRGRLAEKFGFQSYAATLATRDLRDRDWSSPQHPRVTPSPYLRVFFFILHPSSFILYQ